MRVAILVDTDFEQAEMTEPRKALEAAGQSDTHFYTSGSDPRHESRSEG